MMPRSIGALAHVAEVDLRVLVGRLVAGDEDQLQRVRDRRSIELLARRLQHAADVLWPPLVVSAKSCCETRSRSSVKAVDVDPAGLGVVAVVAVGEQRDAQLRRRLGDGEVVDHAHSFCRAALIRPSMLPLVSRQMARSTSACRAAGGVGAGEAGRTLLAVRARPASMRRSGEARDPARMRRIAPCTRACFSRCVLRCEDVLGAPGCRSRTQHRRPAVVLSRIVAGAARSPRLAPALAMQLDAGAVLLRGAAEAAMHLVGSDGRRRSRCLPIRRGVDPLVAAPEEGAVARSAAPSRARRGSSFSSMKPLR